MASRLTLTFTDDEDAALQDLSTAVLGTDLSAPEREAALAEAAKRELRRWLVARKIDLDGMLLDQRWPITRDQESVVARTEAWRDAVTIAEGEERNARLRRMHEAVSEAADAAEEAGDQAEAIRLRELLPTLTGDEDEATVTQP